MDIGAVDHCCYNGAVSREPRKERLRAHSVKFLHFVLASVLAGTPPLAAFTRSGESTGLENRELLPLDSRRGECARVRHSLFGGGGAGPVESDSQSDIPTIRPHPRTIFSVMHSRGNLTSI